MKITIDPASFVSTGRNNRGMETGTIEVNIGRRSPVSALAVRFPEGDITVAGFVGRYQTSAKPWRASVLLRASGDLFVHFGRDDRVGRFHKQSGISWEPETFATLTNAAYWQPAGEG